MRLACAAILVCGAALLQSADAARGSDVRLAYLGTAGWQITDGHTTVLVDPYLSRLKRVSPNDEVAADDARPLYGTDDRPEPDAKVIDAHISAADVILITHTHYDHAFDLSYIARRTGATVVGTESTCYVAHA